MTRSLNSFGQLAMFVRVGLTITAAVMCAGSAMAQQDAPPPPGGVPGGAPGGAPGFGGGRQGGPFGGRMPFSFGTVTGGDPATGTIIVSSPFGGAQTIKVNNDTKFVRLIQVTVDKLQVGDQLQVQGVPTSITANTITAGEMPDFLNLGNRGNRGGGPGATPPAPGGAPAGNPGQPAQRVQGPPANASATGKITSKSDAGIVIKISDEISITLKMGPNAKVMKIMTGTINDVKLNDTIMASGAAGADGTFVATGIGINLNQGGMGMGMGRGFGGPGFGGPGFGGGRGGRRGGNGNNGGGAQDGGNIN